MKKIIIAGICLLAFYSIGNTSVKPIINVRSETWIDMKVADFVKLKAKNFEELTGKPMNLKEKLAFSVMKKDMKRELKKNSGLTVNEYLSSAEMRKVDAWVWIVFGVVVLTLIVIIVISSIDVGINWGEG